MSNNDSYLELIKQIDEKLDEAKANEKAILEKIDESQTLLKRLSDVIVASQTNTDNAGWNGGLSKAQRKALLEEQAALMEENVIVLRKKRKN